MRPFLLAFLVLQTAVFAQPAAYGATVRVAHGSTPTSAFAGIQSPPLAICDVQPRIPYRAKGLVVAPGFLDIHTHVRRSIFRDPVAQNYIRQGVTTLMEGNDGSSPLPLAPFLAIFYPARVLDTATFVKPHLYAEGFLWVLVNGKPVVANGKLTSERPGRVLYGPATSPRP